MSMLWDSWVKAKPDCVIARLDPRSKSFTRSCAKCRTVRFIKALVEPSAKPCLESSCGSTEDGHALRWFNKPEIGFPDSKF